MRSTEDISVLLTDKSFQKILAGWIGYDEPRKNRILLQYNLNENEVEQLRQLWLGLNFKKTEMPHNDVEQALQETVWKLAARNISSEGKSKMRNLYDQFAKVAAILIIPLFIYSIYVQFPNSRLNNSADIQWITVNSQSGTVTNLLLPDGSKVFLNAGSSLTYPSHFSGKSRNVTLTGEGYFTIAKNKEMPMIVSVGDLDLKVYGTTFDLNSYPSDNFCKVSLIEGSISLSSKQGRLDGKDEFFIKPGQTVTYSNESKKLNIQNDDIYSLTAWKDGLLVFRNTTFESVIKQLSRKFNVDIVLKDTSLASIPMDATFREENINEILRLISLGTSFSSYYSPTQKLPDGSFRRSIIYINK
jgi:transmembrane sensor